MEKVFLFPRVQEEQVNDQVSDPHQRRGVGRHYLAIGPKPRINLQQLGLLWVGLSVPVWAVWALLVQAQTLEVVMCLANPTLDLYPCEQ